MGKTFLPFSVGTDLNTVVTSGFYAFNGTPVNGPSGVVDSVMTVSSPLGADSVISQTVVDYSTGESYARGGYIPGNLWSPWRQLATTTYAQAAADARYGKNNILGTVSHASGVPTGAVIESGSNANGQYVKFADGTLICTAFLSLEFANTSNLHAAWTYPAGFIIVHAIAGNLISGTLGTTRSISTVGAHTFNTLTAGMAVLSLGQFVPEDADLGAIQCIAIGRWF